MCFCFQKGGPPVTGKKISLSWFLNLTWCQQNHILLVGRGWDRGGAAARATSRCFWTLAFSSRCSDHLHSTYGTLEKLLNCCEPPSPYLQNGHNNNTYLIALLWGLNELMYGGLINAECLGQCLAHSKCYLSVSCCHYELACSRALC